MFYVIQCRFSKFLIQLCIKNAFFFRSVQKYYYQVQKNCFFLVRAEILLSRDKVSLGSRAGPFLGFVKKYWFLEKYTPLLPTPMDVIGTVSARSNKMLIFSLISFQIGRQITHSFVCQKFAITTEKYLSKLNNSKQAKASGWKSPQNRSPSKWHHMKAISHLLKSSSDEGGLNV